MKNFSVREFWKNRKTLISDTLEGSILVLGFAWLYYDSFRAVPVLIPFIWLWHRERILSRRAKAEEQFKKMFREWILLLSSSLSAGYSVENAMSQSGRELALMFPKGGVMLDELQTMLIKAGNNQRPETLLEELAQKYPFAEVTGFVEVFCAARISGGSLNAVIRATAAQMAEVMDTKREIATLLASKVFEQRIMTIMPAAVLVYVRLASGEFLEALYHNPGGIAVMTVCLAIYLTSYFIGKRLVTFEI